MFPPMEHELQQRRPAALAILGVGAGLLAFSTLAAFAEPYRQQDVRGARPVVVELYTSQGCASCPPADQLMGELAEREDVLSLTFPVDYWNYLGWMDTFARPQNAKRQIAYSRRSQVGRVFTPQMVIDGVYSAVGNQRAEVLDRIAMRQSEMFSRQAALQGRLMAAQHARMAAQQARMAQQMSEQQARLTDQQARLIDQQARAVERQARAAAALAVRVSVAGDEVKVSLPEDDARITAAAPKATVWLFPFGKTDMVHITGGENRGRSMRYSHVVRNILVLGEWDGRAATFEHTLADRDRGQYGYAVIVQEDGVGPVVAASWAGDEGRMGRKAPAPEPRIVADPLLVNIQQ
ncbi:MAG: DUF1223 domain-containing protein [Alphaproteobacteria bacterium]